MKNTAFRRWSWPVMAMFPAHWPSLLAAIGLILVTRSDLQAQALVTTIGGGSTTKPYSGFINGDTLTQAKFSAPAGLAMDPSSTVLFVADYTNNAIRMVSQAGNTSNSVTTTFAASAQGVAHPLAVVVDGKTNVFVLNHGTGANGSVLRIAGAGYAAGTVTTLATSLASATAITLDGLDNCYVAVSANKVIRIATNGVTSTVGTVSASGTSLQGIAFLANGQLALSDAGNNGILTMNPTNGATANLTGFHGAGDTLGGSSVATFRTPEAISAAGGSVLVVADYGNDKVKLVDASGNVTLLYGVSSNLWITGSGEFPGWADGLGTATNGSAESRQPYGVVVASDGSVFASEDYYDVLRHVTDTGLKPPAPSGSGSGSGGGGGPVPPTTFNGPAGIAYDSIGNYLYVANPPNNTVQQIDLNLTTNATSTVLYSTDGLTNPVSVLEDTNENLYVLNRGTGANGYVLEFDMFGNAYGPIITGLNQPTAFAMDGSGNILVAEQAGKILAFGTSIATTMATITNAGVSLQGIAIFDDGTIAVSDAGNAVVWALDPITRVVSKLTGQLDVPGLAVGSTNFAELNQPHQLTRAGGNQIVAADYGNNRVVLIQRTGYVITNTATYHLNPFSATVWFGNSSDPVATNSTRFVPMAEPYGVAVGSGGVVFDSEDFYSDVREMTATAVPSPGTASTIDFPSFQSLGGVALNSSNTVLYVTDPVNNTVSVLNLANNQTTVFLDSSSGIYRPVDVALDIDNNLYVLNQGTGGNGSIMSFDQFGYLIATNAASLSMPTAMKMDLTGNIYVSELNGEVQQFSGSTSNTLGIITTNENVQLEGIAVLDNGFVVVSDAGNDVVWAIPPGTTNAVLFTGAIGVSGTNFGSVAHARLNRPRGLAEVAGGQLLIADSGNNRVVLSDDTGTISSSLNSSNADIWFGVPTDPVTAGNANFVPMVSPVGLAVSPSGTVYDSEAVYRDVRGILNTGLQPPSRPPPPPPPVIGWFDYEENNLFEYVTVLHPVTIATFNNDLLLAVNPNTNGVSTYYVYGTPPYTNTPSASDGTTPPYYENGLLYAEPLPSFGVSNLVIKAINIDSIGQQSAVTTAQFIFAVASPEIGGFNGAQFTVSDITTNAVLYYTIDGSDPTDGPPSIGPISLVGTNTTTLSIFVNSNVTFKVRGYRDGYLPSGIAQQSFSPSNFVANTISFGFASGEASSDFVAAPGQTFFAPVTMTTLAGAVMYSLQFNVTVTNAGANPGPAITPDAFGFQSMLMQPLPDKPGVFVPIEPYAYVAPGIDPQPEPSSIYYNGGWYQSLETFNSQENLLTVGWLERMGQTNLYDTLTQNLLTYSLAHDDFFPNTTEPEEVILGGYSFVVPGSATNGQTYQIQIGRPSATTDGVGAPGSSVYIADPTNGATAGGAPINGLKFVTVGQRTYVAGSVYPFRWFNAGDFGGTNIVNADVEQVFQSAIYGLDTPPQGSDFFDAMDSCGGTYVDLGHGYLEFNSYISGTNATAPLFNGDDATINQIAFGDGVLDVCDVYVTFRRSLDPSLVWFERYWNNGERVAQIVPNVSANVVGKSTSVRPKATTSASVKATAVASARAAASAKATVAVSPRTASASTTSSTSPQVNFVAVDTPAAAGQTIHVPITADVFGSYPLRVLMLNLTVTPLDGSPDLTTPVEFTQTATALGTPLTTTSDGNDNFAAVWLNSTNSGITGADTIGYLTMTIPATANAMSAYAVHFDHASASPNGLAAFPRQTLTGLVTLSSRTNSYYNDGIPDSWRLRWFGTIYNLLSVSNACPSGDGVDNWEKYVAGVDPNVAHDFPSTTAKVPVPAGYTTAIHWPTVSGTQYVVLRSTSVFNGPWTAVSTNTGTGTEMEFDDTNTGQTLFYRVLIQQ